MMYSCGHNLQGERNYEYEALEPWQRMPSSTGLCSKCQRKRDAADSINGDYWHGLKPVVEFTPDKPYPWEGFVEQKEIEVPHEMRKAFCEAWDQGLNEVPVSPSRSEVDGYILKSGHARFKALEGALRWQIEHLPLPSLNDPSYSGPEWTSGWNCALEAVRRMFVAELEMPEEIKDLIATLNPDVVGSKELILEAYKRGLNRASGEPSPYLPEELRASEAAKDERLRNTIQKMRKDSTLKEQKEAAIRQEARRWCLEEFERASKGESMEVGSDVYDVYHHALHRWNQRKAKPVAPQDVRDDEIAGMESAAKLFDGLSFGPYYHPSQTIRDAIEARRGNSPQK